MIKVTVVNEGVSFEVPKDSKIVDYLPDECNMLFGCRKGSCGTCVCTVRKGEELLVPITLKEEESVRKAGGSPNQRLTCQLWTREIEKEGEIEIEY